MKLYEKSLYRQQRNIKIKRMLCILSSMDAGGAETFLMKVFRNIDKTRYMMDFCLSVQRKSFYENEIEMLGGKIFRVIPKSDNFIQSFLTIRRIVKHNKYNYVMLCNQYALAVVDLIAAKCGGAKILAYRANSTSISRGGSLRFIYHNLLRVPAKTISNVKISPSIVSAKFVFGDRALQDKKFYLIRNGIDLSLYYYNIEKRNMLRSKLGINSAFAIFQVGRFSPEKNHAFTLVVFARFVKIRPNSILLLAGSGLLLEDCKERANELGITDKVMFLGVRHDIPELFQAVDILILPSKYEGMPNAVIEAQATGLPCLVSDTVTPEANVTGLVSYLPLKEEEWLKNLTNATIKDARLDESCKMRAAGYDIKDVVEKFTEAIFEK
jgi:glycosyltransferase involved in cell wall biosynthesis